MPRNKYHPPLKVYVVVPRTGGPVAYSSWSRAFCRTWIARSGQPASSFLTLAYKMIGATQPESDGDGQ